MTHGKCKFCLLLAMGGARINWQALFFCLSPLVMLCAVVLYVKNNPFDWVPLWSDEIGWYNQIASVAQYGRPLGHTGYNETHAAIGTFGPWGAASVYAMSLYAALFGWHHYSPAFLNVSYMMLANLVFFLLARPGKRATLVLAFLNCVLFVNIQYMFASMSECTRFSMATVLAGIFCRLLRNGNGTDGRYRFVLWGVAPCALLFFVNCYILFAFLLPVYGYVLFRHLQPKRCRIPVAIALCAVMPALVTLGSLFLLMKTSSPYPNIMQMYLDQPGVSALLKVLWETVKVNYVHSDVKFILNATTRDNGTVSAFIFFYYIIAAVAVVRVLWRWIWKKDVHALDFLVPYALLVFIAAFYTLYSTVSPWTYIRGLNVALVFGTFIICASEWRGGGRLVLCMAFMQFLPFSLVILNNVDARGKPQNGFGGGRVTFEKYRDVFAKKLRLSPVGDRWDNTIALVGGGYNFYCMVPPGFSFNSILQNMKPNKAKYVFVAKNAMSELKGYRRTYLDGNFSIFEKGNAE